MVTVTNGKAIPEFIPIGDYIYKDIEINIKDCSLENITDVIDLLRSRINELINDAYKPKGYVLRWNLKGRGKIHELFKEGKEDIIKGIMETLNSEFEGASPFVHTDEIELNIGSDIELDENNKLYTGIDQIINKINEDETFRKDMLSKLGSIYDLREDNEDSDDTKVKADIKFIQDILEEAQEIIIDKYIERRDSDEI